ncbi:MAG: hypothetical protein IIZ78_00850 [Clostridiales bacterium]|nr:hypothetical protein [Clostridiales bacterium]
MTNEDNNSEFSDFINSIIKAAVLKKSAFELADHLSKAFTDNDCSEFISWLLYSLGSKYGYDALGIAKQLADNFADRYTELLAKGEDATDTTIGGVEVIFADRDDLNFNTDDEDHSEEWDDYDGEDFSDLWDSL